MLVLQDWASDDFLKTNKSARIAERGYDPSRRTNTTLHRLVRDHLCLRMSRVYATNAFPFVKPGKMSAGIRSDRFRSAVEMFLLCEIKIVKPRILIVFGLDAFNAIAWHLAEGKRQAGTLAEAITWTAQKPLRIGDSEVYCLAHPANRNRGSKRIEQDWKVLGNRYLTPCQNLEM